MADLATAYLRLIPSLKGSQKTIENELSGINTSSAGDKLGSGLGEGIKGGLGKIAIGSFLGNILTQGVDMAISAATDTFKQAFSEAADFEQLAGGVETLFGDSAEKAMENAQRAFKTAGISANEYMEQVNSFAASLRQALGPERAGELADYADKAVQDMADNANKMGTEMASIQNAYQGFAKQNYTMLDNLKLGYGGTKEEMKRLLEDASKLAGVEFNIESYSDVIDAIHMIQENMGITGTTAEEAAHTVSGSIAMLQSSWTNLLADLGNPNGDIEARIQDVVDSIGAVMENVIPLVERILSGMGQAIGNFAARAGEYFMEHRTEVYDKVGEFIKAALEAIVTAVPYIIEGIAYLVASLIEYVVTHIPDMLNAAGQLMLAFLQAIADAWGPAMTAINDIGQGILDAIGGFFQSMFDAGANIIGSLIDGILSGFKPLGDALASVGDFIVSHKGPPSYDKVMLRDNAKLIMGGLTETIIAEIPSLDRAMQMVNGAISVDADISPASTNQATTTPGAPIVNVYFNDEESVDDYERGRRIGAAAAYELRMQGVCA